MANVSTRYVVFLKADFLRCSALARNTVIISIGKLVYKVRMYSHIKAPTQLISITTRYKINPLNKCNEV